MHRNLLLAKMKKNNGGKPLIRKVNKKVSPKPDSDNQELDLNKFNPDVPAKFQEGKNDRKSVIKPANFKVQNLVSEEINDSVEDLLKKQIMERNKKVIVPKNTIKKRVLDKETEDYEKQKTIVVENKKEYDKKIEQGRIANMNILDMYKD